jgi:nanoRNase/pAp phosphatase (c-di-AMP/oligoRNAs hydrolase)
MDNAEQQLVEKLKTTNNVLVTVSRNPSVDQLAALLGLTLSLNKLGKHAAAVFSGEVPSTLEFLQPEATIEKNTDSLRDFIIALDKSKADKLRYKVEDDVVRIFITPYKTSISDADLEFSQGDFNVDLVIALGVQQQEDLDEAITTHGRILHDATVASINLTPDGGLGSISWHDVQSSSLSESVTDVAKALEVEFDEQIATALLTGIVAETDRFSNDKTSSHAMSASALLMAAGANQQLVAAKLEEPVQSAEVKLPDVPEVQAEVADDETQKDGTLQIEHDPNEEPAADSESSEAEEPAATKPEAPEEEESEQPEPPDATEANNDIALPEPQLETDDGTSQPEEKQDEAAPAATPEPANSFMDQPPAGNTSAFSASTGDDGSDEVPADPLSVPTDDDQAVLDRISGASTASESVIQPLATSPEPVITDTPNTEAAPAAEPEPEQPSWMPPGATEEPSIPAAAPQVIMPDTGSSDAPVDDNRTLTELEASVNSPHVTDARDEVSRALNDGSTDAPQPPIQALNAQPLGDSLHPSEPAPTVDPTSFIGPAPDPIATTQQAEAATTAPEMTPPQPPQANTDAALPPAPPVPPPIPFQFGAPPPSS